MLLTTLLMVCIPIVSVNHSFITHMFPADDCGGDFGDFGDF